MRDVSITGNNTIIIPKFVIIDIIVSNRKVSRITEIYAISALIIDNDVISYVPLVATKKGNASPVVRRGVIISNSVIDE